jgi:subtilisin family serine protease
MANYIVEMDSGVHADATAAQSAITGAGASITTTFSLSLTYLISATAEQLAAISGVKYSEDADADSGLGLQSFSTHHFRYLDNRYYDSSNIAGNITESYSFSSWEPKYSGDNKTVYLIDSGINAGHVEFANATITNLHSAYGSTYSDSTGHGTSMAGLIAGENIGLARDCTIKNVKLFDEASGNISVGNVITALDAVLSDHNGSNVADVKVLCAPWTTARNNLIDSKIGEINNSNIVVVAAAGNSNDDVANYSPAGVADIITVGSHDTEFVISEFTNTAWDGGSDSTSFPNYGAALDIFTIGESVTTCSHLSSVIYGRATGTSMSTALVAGGVAQYIEKHPGKSSNEIKDVLIAEGSIRGKLRLSLGSGTTSANLDLMNESVLQLDSGGSDESINFSNTFASGRILTMQSGTTANVNLDINSTLSNIHILPFSPLAPWMSYDANTGIITADTSSLDANLSPGVFIFGIRGKTASEYVVVEEFSIGVYDTAESELESSSSYYYDSDNTEYDEAEFVTYSVAGSRFIGSTIK